MILHVVTVKTLEHSVPITGSKGIAQWAGFAFLHVVTIEEIWGNSNPRGVHGSLHYPHGVHGSLHYPRGVHGSLHYPRGVYGSLRCMRTTNEIVISPNSSAKPVNCAHAKFLCLHRLWAQLWVKLVSSGTQHWTLKGAIVAEACPFFAKH